MSAFLPARFFAGLAVGPLTLSLSPGGDSTAEEKQ
jgi:hypothetical protein